MNLLIYFKQGAPTPFVNRYTHGPKEVSNLSMEDGFLVIDTADKKRADVINLNIILGYEVTE